MSDATLLSLVKTRIGVAQSVTNYDEDISLMIDDAIHDMEASGVVTSVTCAASTLADGPIVNAVSLYCKAYMGDDRTNTDKYMEMYQKRVSRLVLDYDEEGEEESDS